MLPNNTPPKTESPKFSIFLYFPIYLLIILLIVWKFDFIQLNVINKIDNNVLFIGLSCISIFTTIFYIQKSVQEKFQNPNNLYIIIGSFAFFVFLIVFKFSSFQFFLIKVLLYLFLASIILVLLAIVYQVSDNYLQKQGGWLGFIIKFIFYIPCVITDFFKYILNDYNSTSTIVFVLFILEILIILAYFYFPKIVNYFMHYYSVQLLKEPVQLNKETILKFPSNIYSYYDRIEILKKNVKDSKIPIIDSLNKNTIYVNQAQPSIEAKITEFNNEMQNNGCNDKCKNNYASMIKQLNTYSNALYNEISRETGSILLNGGADYPYKKTQNFSLSLWVNLNTQSSSRVKKDSPTNIFKFASSPDASSGHPMIAYTNNNSDTESYVIYFENANGRTYVEMVEDGSVFLISLPSQKWNNFVFTYTDNKVDLFINGVLVKTHNFTISQRNNVIAIDDNMYIGTPTQSDNLYNYGAYGAVCNVVYYTIPLELSTIIYNYNISVINNPPYLD
jgi:hypothetical protein